MVETCQTPSASAGTGITTSKTHLGLQILTGHSAIGQAVNQVSFWVKNDGGLASGTLTAQYWSYASWNGNTPGTPTATSSNSINITTIGTSFEKVTFSFASAHTVSANDLFTVSGAADANELGVDGDANSCTPNCTTQYYMLYRTSPAGWDPYTPSSNCKFCYNVGDTPSTGTRLPPPPLIARF